MSHLKTYLVASFKIITMINSLTLYLQAFKHYFCRLARAENSVRKNKINTVRTRNIRKHRRTPKEITRNGEQKSPIGEHLNTTTFWVDLRYFFVSYRIKKTISGLSDKCLQGRHPNYPGVDKGTYWYPWQ